MNDSGGRHERSWRFMGGEQGGILTLLVSLVGCAANLSNLSEKRLKFEASTVKALVCEAYGPPESLKLVDLPDPEPGPGEALIDVAYASLNFFDLLVIENKYQAKPPLPFSPAAEFSGRIAALGPEVGGFKVGARGLGYTGLGC